MKVGEMRGGFSLNGAPGDSAEVFGLGGTFSEPAAGETESFGLSGFGLGDFSASLQSEAKSAGQGEAISEAWNHSPVDPPPPAEAPVEEIVAAPLPTASSNSFGQTKSWEKAYTSSAPEQSERPQSRWGGGDPCTRCKKTVYMAELREAGEQKFHRSCFSCAICKKMLEPSSFALRQEEIYCKGCYCGFPILDVIALSSTATALASGLPFTRCID